MPIMQQFEYTEQNTPVGLFDLVATQTQDALTLSATDSASLANCQQQIQTLSDSIRLVDSIANDTARLHALQNQLVQMIQLCDSTAQVIQTAKNALLNSTAITTNAAINAALDHETAEKLVNEIYLNTIAKGVDEFSPAQIQTLQLVSAACPDVVGMSVYQARAMYDLVAEVDMLSKAGCTSANNMEMQPTNVENTAAEKANKIVLYPNPTNTAINLHLLGFENVETQIIIINVLGEQVLQIQNNTENTVQINVNHLPAGVYVCQIKGNNVMVTKNFIITK